MSEPIPVVVDSDGGCDDAAALWFALTDPRLDVLAVTAVWGNTHVAQAAANLRLVCEAAGRPEVPVAIGAAAPSGPAPILPGGDFHGPDGLGGHARPPLVGPIAEPAVDLLVRVTGERPGEVSVLTIGPLTNLAAALASDPSLARRTRRLVTMGGSIRRGGNATPSAEANVGHDPGAAAAVVRAGWSAPPLLVGLDVTLAAPIGPGEIALLEARSTAATTFLAGPLGFHRMRSGNVAGAGSQPIHDLLAACALADPALVDGPVVPLAVDDAGGPAWGMTVADLRGGDPSNAAAGSGFSPWRVALTVDADRFRSNVRTFLSA